MQLLAHRFGVRLRPLRCNNIHHLPSNCIPSTWFVRHQRRVLQTAISLNNKASTNRRVPFLRSPRQWSHIIHHIRKPTTLTASTTMAADSAPNSEQMRTHMGHSHSHGHHHHHDNTYLTSGNKNDPGVRITRIGKPRHWDLVATYICIMR